MQVVAARGRPGHHGLRSRAIAERVAQSICVLTSIDEALHASASRGHGDVAVLLLPAARSDEDPPPVLDRRVLQIASRLEHGIDNLSQSPNLAFRLITPSSCSLLVHDLDSSLFPQNHFVCCVSRRPFVSSGRRSDLVQLECQNRAGKQMQSEATSPQLEAAQGIPSRFSVARKLPATPDREFHGTFSSNDLAEMTKPCGRESRSQPGGNLANSERNYLKTSRLGLRRRRRSAASSGNASPSRVLLDPTGSRDPPIGCPGIGRGCVHLRRLGLASRLPGRDGVPTYSGCGRRPRWRVDDLS